MIVPLFQKKWDAKVRQQKNSGNPYYVYVWQFLYQIFQKKWYKKWDSNFCINISIFVNKYTQYAYWSNIYITYFTIFYIIIMRQYKIKTYINYTSKNYKQIRVRNHIQLYILITHYNQNKKIIWQLPTWKTWQKIERKLKTMKNKNNAHANHINTPVTPKTYDAETITTLAENIWTF